MPLPPRCTAPWSWLWQITIIRLWPRTLYPQNLYAIFWKPIIEDSVNSLTRHLQQSYANSVLLQQDEIVSVIPATRYGHAASYQFKQLNLRFYAKII